MTRVFIADDISKLPRDRAAITELHFKLELTRFAREEPPPEIFELENLRRLELQMYSLRRIPDAIRKLTKLRELSITAPWTSRVESISPEIGALKELEVLEVDAEPMTAMPPAILELDNLKVLKWKGYKLREIPDLSRLAKLEVLWLDIHTAGLPAFSRDMPKLRELRLYNAKSHLRDWVWSLTHLRSLGLDYVDKDVPLHFDRLPQLEAIWLRKSRRPLHPAIEHLEHLRHLEVRGELVTEIPSGLFRNGSPLETLRIEESKLKMIPSSVGNATELRVLSVWHNALKVIPDSITQCAKLESLSICENTIAAFPHALGDLVALRTLDAHKNKIAAVPDTIGSLQNLESLDLSANRIAALPRSFFTLKKLRSLSIAGNLLPKVPVELAELRLLESLLLQNNPATKGQKNKAADAILEGLAKQRASASPDDAAGAGLVSLRARLSTGDVEGARELAGSEDVRNGLFSLLDDDDPKVRARALALLGEVLPDPFANELRGRVVVLQGNAKSVKRPALQKLLEAQGALLANDAKSTKPPRLLVLGEKPGAYTVAEGDAIAALPQLERWIVSAAKPHLMTEATRSESSENLGALLRAPTLENVMLGLKLADEGGIPTPLLPLVLAMGRAHADANVRKAANVAFGRYAPPPLKLAVENALGRVTLTEGTDGKPVKTYKALSTVDGFDVDEFALEVTRLSRLGVGYLMSKDRATRERAFRALVRDGVLALTGRERLNPIPEEIGAVADVLRKFTLPYSSLTALPERFAELDALEHIDIGSNRFATFPRQLTKLPKLKHLALCVETVRSGDLSVVGDLRAIETLALTYVRLPMPDEIGKLRSLRALTWESNELALSPALAELKNLESLSLGHTEAEAVPPEIEPLLSQLSTLRINLPAAVVEKLRADHPQLRVEAP